MITILLKSQLLAITMIASLFFTACSGEKQNNNAQDESTEMQDDPEMMNNETGHEGMTSEAHQEMQEVSEISSFENVPADVKLHISKLLNRYFEVKNALTKDQSEEAKAAAQQIVGELNQFDATAMEQGQKGFYDESAAKIKDDAEHIIGTGAISHQRDHFPTLSKEMYAMAKAFDATTSEIYYQYCPMAFDNKGAYWLSEIEEIRNPYFGEQMLSCGETKETL